MTRGTGPFIVYSVWERLPPRQEARFPSRELADRFVRTVNQTRPSLAERLVHWLFRFQGHVVSARDIS